MKPKYHITYNFPNEKVKQQYCTDFVDNLYSNLEIYKKYGKYRILEKWEDFEAGFIERLNSLDEDIPDLGKVSHLVLYDDICIGYIRQGSCNEGDMLEYARNNVSTR